MGPSRRLLLGIVLISGSVSLASAANPPDPLQSPTWEAMHQRVLSGASYQFSDAVRVIMPERAEDATRVPVHVELRGLDNPRELVIFADLNPITEVIRLRADSTLPARGVGIQMKVQQATPIRAAVRDAQGQWHVAGHWISAAGGGCGAPSRASVNPDWNRDFGLATGRRWVRHTGTVPHTRINVLIHHPMDTGFVAGIPRFHLERVAVRTPSGASVLEAMLSAAVSENPILSFDLPGTDTVAVEARDNNGNPFVVEWVN